MKIKSLIIEDEQPARNLIKEFLKNYPEIEVMQEVVDGFTAVKLINELKPDMIFLDIQLPKLNGFEILELIEYKPFVIFTTAYDEFAIKAFEMNAVDYLLKPFSAERFDAAISRTIDKINTKKVDDRSIDNIIKSKDLRNEILDRIVVKNGSKIHVIPVDSIIYFEAQDDYVMIYAQDGKHLKEKTMKYYEAHLDQNKFIRIHRSYIINISFLSQIEHFAKESYVAILKNGVKLKVSDSGYKNLKNILKF